MESRIAIGSFQEQPTVDTVFDESGFIECVFVRKCDCIPDLAPPTIDCYLNCKGSGVELIFQQAFLICPCSIIVGPGAKKIVSQHAETPGLIGIS